LTIIIIIIIIISIINSFNIDDNYIVIVCET